MITRTVLHKLMLMLTRAHNQGACIAGRASLPTRFFPFPVPFGAGGGIMHAGTHRSLGSRVLRSRKAWRRFDRVDGRPRWQRLVSRLRVIRMLELPCAAMGGISFRFSILDALLIRSGAD